MPVRPGRLVTIVEGQPALSRNVGRCSEQVMTHNGDNVLPTAATIRRYQTNPGGPRARMMVTLNPVAVVGKRNVRNADNS